MCDVSIAVGVYSFQREVLECPTGGVGNAYKAGSAPSLCVGAAMRRQARHRQAIIAAARREIDGGGG